MIGAQSINLLFFNSLVRAIYLMLNLMLDP